MQDETKEVAKTVNSWTLKWHSRREMWIVENAFKTRWAFATLPAAQSWLRARNLVATILAQIDSGPRQMADKTARRRERIEKRNKVEVDNG